MATKEREIDHFGHGRQPAVWCETGTHWVAADKVHLIRNDATGDECMECGECLRRLEREAD